MRSLRNLMARDLGFNRERMLLARIDPVTAGYKGASVPALYRNVLDKLRQVPGVRSATLSNVGLFRGDSGDQISAEGAVQHQPDDMRSRWTLVGPDYFSTLGIPLLRGREMNASEAARGVQVCVINEAFARFFFPNADPIGRHVTDEYPTTRESYEIIGVAANAREHLPNERERPRFYATLFHPIGTVDEVTFLVSAGGDPVALISSVRRAVAAVDRNVPVVWVRTVNEQLGRRVVTQRIVADLSGFFSMAALLLAAVGLYGVTAYSVERRTGEIGIRMALGASGGTVLWMVEREALELVAAGVAIGLPAALLTGRFIAAWLFGLKPADPWTIAVAVAIILAATLLAAYAPARRATRIDPMNALRLD
jgi:predicted permease